MYIKCILKTNYKMYEKYIFLNVKILLPALLYNIIFIDTQITHTHICMYFIIYIYVYIIYIYIYS